MYATIFLFFIFYFYVINIIRVELKKETFKINADWISIQKNADWKKIGPNSH